MDHPAILPPVPRRYITNVQFPNRVADLSGGNVTGDIIGWTKNGDDNQKVCMDNFGPVIFAKICIQWTFEVEGPFNSGIYKLSTTATASKTTTYAGGPPVVRYL
jgi:hypothetical protein